MAISSVPCECYRKTRSYVTAVFAQLRAAVFLLHPTRGYTVVARIFSSLMMTSVKAGLPVGSSSQACFMMS